MTDRLPLTVISGYLGAGKTTLINRLLAEAHGFRLMVMVNDFGAINIDAALIETADEDTITLSNGCVCCTMGADLFMAVGDVLDRPLRPDHLLIEASGIADPARIANVADAEPDLMRAGIVTVVDAGLYETLCADDRIAPQVVQQVRAADVVFLSKAVGNTGALSLKLSLHSGAEVIDLASLDRVAPAVLGLRDTVQAPAGGGHGAYVSWHADGPATMTRAALAAKLDARPEGLFRFKGIVGHDSKSAWEVQCVGPTARIKPIRGARDTQVVGIGMADRITRDAITAWWNA